MIAALSVLSKKMSMASEFGLPPFETGESEDLSATATYRTAIFTAGTSLATTQGSMRF
jgi:hypothetical protein